MSNLIDLAIKKLYQYVDQRVEDVRPFRAIVTGQSSGMVQVRRIHATTGETALRARVAGFDLATSDEVVCLPMADGIPVVVGKVQRSSPSGHAITAPLTTTSLIAVAANSPAFHQAIQNSADTASSTDTANYVVTLTTNFALPTGTWTVYAITSQMLSHSAAAGVVRARAVIDGSAGTSLSAGLPIDSTRANMTTTYSRTGRTGTIAVAAEYRPNTTGTAYSGGGTIFAVGIRTS